MEKAYAMRGQEQAPTAPYGPTGPQYKYAVYFFVSSIDLCGQLLKSQYSLTSYKTSRQHIQFSIMHWSNPPDLTRCAVTEQKLSAQALYKAVLAIRERNKAAERNHRTAFSKRNLASNCIRVFQICEDGTNVVHAGVAC